MRKTQLRLWSASTTWSPLTNALLHAEDCLQYMSNLRDSAIFCFCAIPQVDKNDPNATRTLSRIESIQKVCIDSRTLNRRRSYIVDGSISNSALIFILLIILSVIIAYVLSNRKINFEIACTTSAS